MNKILEAAQFAKEKHKGQYKKFTGEPYINHPARVAQNVILHPLADEIMVCAAWLHDVVEDCNVSPDVILDKFGYRVYKYVLALTNPSNGSKAPRPIRQEMDREHIAKAGQKEKIIKLYDRLDNICDMVLECQACDSPNRDFLKVYSQETVELLNLIGDADPNITQQILEKIT